MILLFKCFFLPVQWLIGLVLLTVRATVANFGQLIWIIKRPKTLDPVQQWCLVKSDLKAKMWLPALNLSKVLYGASISEECERKSKSTFWRWCQQDILTRCHSQPWWSPFSPQQPIAFDWNLAKGSVPNFSFGLQNSRNARNMLFFNLIWRLCQLVFLEASFRKWAKTNFYKIPFPQNHLKGTLWVH